MASAPVFAGESRLAAAISANAGSSSTIVLWVGSVMADSPIGERRERYETAALQSVPDNAEPWM